MTIKIPFFLKVLFCVTLLTVANHFGLTYFLEPELLGENEIFLFALAVLPTLVILIFLMRTERLSIEKKLVWGGVWRGIFSAILVLLLLSPFFFILEWAGHLSRLYPIATSVFISFAFAAIPEEYLKFRMLANIAQMSEFHSVRHCMICGAITSLGFATLENILYVFVFSEAGFHVAIARAFTAVPAHASLGVIMGYYYGKTNFKNWDTPSFFQRSLLIPILLHGLYNTCLFTIDHLGSSKPATQLMAIGVWMAIFAYLLSLAASFLKKKSISLT